MRSRRTVAARVVAGVGAVFWGWLFFGAQDTLTVFVEGQDFASHYLLESGWGLLFLVLVAVPLTGLAWRPHAVVLVGTVSLVAVAVLAAALLAGSPAHLIPGLGILLTAAAVPILARPDARVPRLRVDPPLAALTLVAAVPSIGYALRMARATADAERTAGLDHYPIQAALGVAVLLLAGLIAGARAWSMTWLSTTALAVTVGWIGIESVVYPHLRGSLGTWGGWCAAGWALTFLVVGLRPGARTDAASDRPDRPSSHAAD